MSDYAYIVVRKEDGKQEPALPKKVLEDAVKSARKLQEDRTPKA